MSGVPAYGERVQETSTTTGTGTLTLLGSVAGFEAFATAFPNASTPNVPYTITDGTGNWETGYGTYTLSGTTLSRSVSRSSNANALVSFGAGTKQVFCAVLTAEMQRLFGGPGVPTGWDTADQSPDATGLVFTNGNKTVDSSGSLAGHSFGIVRSATHKTKGKWYVEIYFDSIGTANLLYFTLGFWQKSATLPNSNPGWGSSGAPNVTWTSGTSYGLGQIYANSINSTLQSYNGAIANGATLCMRLDMGNQGQGVNWQVRVENGTWVNVGLSANTGGGTFFSAPVAEVANTDMAVFVELNNGVFGENTGSSGPKVTIKTTAATQAYNGGAGYTPWDDIAPDEVPAANVRLLDYANYYTPRFPGEIKDVEAALARLGILAQPSSLCDNLSTTSLPEGSNLYYTDARARAAATDKIEYFYYAQTTTWYKDGNAKSVTVYVMGAGGGGGSGRKGAAATVRCGGGGGGGGSNVQQVTFAANVLGSSETLIVGAGGTAGAAVTANSTNGNNGGTGGASKFGSWLLAPGGAGGAGGTAVAGAGGAGGIGFPPLAGATSGTAGGAASTTGGTGGNGTASNMASCGGGSGGGISTANTAAAGGAGGALGSTTVAGYGAVIAGGVGGTVGNPGNTGFTASLGNPMGGSGASGGGGSNTAAAGSGGNGGASQGGTGCGAGGGGASTDSVGNSGAGGIGSDGLIVVITHF